jgi:hypothetical protein
MMPSTINTFLAILSIAIRCKLQPAQNNRNESGTEGIGCANTRDQQEKIFHNAKYAGFTEKLLTNESLTGKPE